MGLQCVYTYIINHAVIFEYIFEYFTSLQYIFLQSVIRISMKVNEKYFIIINL